MSVILFSENDKVMGTFDDKKSFKTKTFHYILSSLIDKGYLKTKKQCGTTIKEDLKLLYDDSDYTFMFKDIKYSKKTLELNILEFLKEEKVSMEDINFIVYKLVDIDKPLELLEVSDLYNKNELS